MPDIGLGLADRRTVVVILATVLFATQFLGFKSPVDTDKITIQAIMDLALIAGFFYVSRNIIRLILGIMLATGRATDMLQHGSRCSIDGCSHYSRNSLKERIEESPRKFLQYFADEERFNPKGIFGVIDRLAVFPLCFVVLLPDRIYIPTDIFMGLGLISFSHVEFPAVIPLVLGPLSFGMFPIWKVVGMSGLLLCAASWVMADTFSLMLEDGVAKERREKEEIARLSKSEPNSSVWVSNMPSRLD